MGSAWHRASFRPSRRPRAALLALIALLLAMALALPAASALAAASLTLSPASALPGETVTATGVDLPHDAMLHFSFDGSETGMPTEKASSTGTVDVTFQVPADAAVGPHDVSVALGSNVLASATLTVPPPATPTPNPTATPKPTATTAASATPRPSATAAATPTAAVTPTPTTAPTAAPTPTPTPTSGGSGSVPNFKHIYWIVMENHEYSSIVGSSSAPYINTLISSYGLLTNYYAVAHPSEPNYLSFFSGSTQGVTDDGTYNFSGKNLADLLESGGKSWHVYAQDYPGNCYTGSSSSGGVDLLGLSGSYVRKHNPAISFTDISGNSTRCSHITDLASFDPAAASFELIVPNLNNDMHDGTIAEGDAFLQSFVPLITANPAFVGSALFITWDEGSTNTNGGGHVATIALTSTITPGARSSTSYNHYSLMRTVEKAWGLGCIANDCSANPIDDLPY